MDCGHPCFWNFNSTIPVDVVRVTNNINSELLRELMRAGNLKKQLCMYTQHIFPMIPLLIYFDFLPNFFPEFKLPNLGCGLSVSAAYTLVYMVIKQTNIIKLN